MPTKDQLINYMIDCMGYSLDDVNPDENTVYDLYKQLTPPQVLQCYHYAGVQAPGEIE